MRFTLSVTSIALSFVMTANAQQPAAQQQKPSSNNDDLKPITAVGCLQAGAQPNQFVLMSTADPLAKGVAVAVSGSVPNVTYQLSGGTNLAAHLGHRVEITGRTSGKAQKAVSTSGNVKRAEAPGPDTKVETSEKATIELRDLRIESLKMVSTSCSTGATGK
jgi:hypothetical protein